jgi:mannosyltransferase
VVVLVGAVSAAVTATASWVPSLWGDEAATVLSSERSLPSLWMMTRHLDAMHAAYYLLMHFWIGVFGASAFSVRFPSALAVGAGAAGLVVLLGMLGRGTKAAVLAAVMFTALPRIQYVGQEARSFAWDAALVTWTLIAFIAVGQERLPRHAGWTLYGASAAASVLLFPFDASVVLVTGVVVSSPANRPLRMPWAISSASAVLASSPALVLSYLERRQVAYLANSPVTPSQVLVSTWFGNPVFAVVAWTLVVVALGAAVLRSSADGRTSVSGGPPRISQITLLVSWAFLPGAVLLVTQPFFHNYAERYIAFCAPAVGALIAEGVAVLARWRRPAGVAAALSMLAVAIPAAVYQRTPFSESGSDWAQVAGFVHDRARPGDDVLFAQTVSSSKRARNSLRLYPQDYVGLRDVALTRPWYECATTWHDEAMSIGDAVRSGRVSSDTVWIVETRGSGSEGMPELRARGYHVVTRRHFDMDTAYELKRRPPAK